MAIQIMIQQTVDDGAGQERQEFDQRWSILTNLAINLLHQHYLDGFFSIVSCQNPNLSIGTTFKGRVIGMIAIIEFQGVM